jgi:glycosyltransferase involved in cell wall biosynthesis
VRFCYDRRVHVCMVSPHMPPQQAANALLPSVLAREFVRSGHQSTFLTHPNPAGVVTPAPGRMVCTARRGHGRLARSPIGALATAARLAAAAARAFRGVDLVHLHSNGFLIDAAGWLAARLGRPTVVTLYGTDIWHFDARRHRRFADIVRGAGAQVYYSRALRDRAVELGLAPADAPVVYAPVDGGFSTVTDDERAALRHALGLSGPLLLTVKRLHEVAGYEDLLRAFTIVAARVPDAQLFIAGDGALRPELERQAAASGLAHRIRFLGVVDNRDLPRYCAAADLFVLPSRLESWGTVMLEALACGTPVVATATAGAREAHGFFDDDVRLTPVEAHEPLAAAIVQALGERRRAGELTRQRIESTFRPAGCAKAYMAVYARVLAGQRRRSPDDRGDQQT